jgi:hypothetical protein
VYIGETGRTLDIRLNEHKKSIIKRDPNISKLAEHVIDTNQRILWNESQVIGHENLWKERKFQEAVEIYRGGNMVISSLSFDTHPVWPPLIRSIKFGIQPKIPLVRRSAILQKRGRTIQTTQQARVVSSSGDLHQ